MPSWQQGTIAPEELLARDTNPEYGTEAHALIRDKIVLVTGAGGSIGSELVRQCLRLNPRKMYFVDNDEYALYRLQLDLDKQALLDDERYILADVADEKLMDRIMNDVEPDVVFHAAACKHLPLLERSPEAAIKNNVFGTESVVKAATKHGVGHVVNISTDKAADPTSVLGWSKRIAEHVANSYAGGHTKIASVRFGNVLGSRGSFLETLDRMVTDGTPVSVTHPEVTRYFMTIPEAAGLVIEAARLANGGSTFVLKMGTSVNIESLVRKFAKLADKPQPVIIHSGLRPGEKLHEELFASGEDYKDTVHPRIMSAHVGSLDIRPTMDLLRQHIDEMAHPKILRDALAFTTV